MKEMEHQHDSCCSTQEQKCGCGCNHEHEEGGLKSKIILIALTVVLLIGAVWVEHNCDLATWQLLLVYLIPYLLIGHETLGEAAEGIAKGDVFNEDFLMVIATIGALCIGFFPGTDTEFPEAVFVMLFFQVGELFEEYAEGKSRDSISHLMNIRPDVANVEREGKVEVVSPEEVKVGETILVKPGEKVPLDGVVVEGCSALNTLALTGESVPRDLNEGDEVVSGCINLTGVIKVRTTKSFGDSTVSKIIALVESADENKSKSEAFITRFARVYTPIVVFAAIALAVIPPVLGALGVATSLFGEGSFGDNFPLWLNRALIFLVVSCPCALVISVPLTFFGGIGGASRNGILVKGSNYMDALAKVGTVVFDKTGTLTHGEFAVEAVHAGDDCSHVGEYSDKEKILLHLAAHAEHFTTHPIGAALRQTFPNEATDGCEVTDVEEIAGHGIRAKVNGKVVCVGNKKMMESIGAKWHDCHQVGTIIHVAIDGKYAGHIVVNDRIKEGSAEAIKQLKNLGVEKTVMLTGDRREVGEDVARKLGLDESRTELLPTDKVTELERLLANKPKNKTLAYVGDGINDAPVLKRADVGIAMGGLGSDAAIEAADVVLMDDEPKKIALAIKIARRTIHIAHENVTFAIGVKVAVLILATVGLGTMWMAVFADVGVTVLAVLNAMRALKKESCGIGRVKAHASLVLLGLVSLASLASCDSVFDVHPYDVHVDGEKNVNAANIKKIEEAVKSKDTIRFAVISDSHQWLNDLSDEVRNINGKSDSIDFVLHLGDVTDFGATQEFQWTREKLQKLKRPFVVLLGNHDCLGTGNQTYEVVFGNPDFSFIAGRVKFLCLNTNAIEYDYSRPVPNFDFMEEQRTADSLDFDRTVICMHAPPYSEQFNNNVAKVFNYYTHQMPGLMFCLYGHGHHTEQNDIYGDGTMYYEVGNAPKRQYYIFTITPTDYRYEIITF